MKKIFILLVIALIATGCNNTNKENELPQTEIPVEEVELEDVFKYVDYNGISIPVLTEALNLDERAYLVRKSHVSGEELEIIPLEYVMVVTSYTNRRAKDGEKPVADKIVCYVTLEKQEDGLSAHMEGYNQRTGKLFVVGDYKQTDDKDVEAYINYYTVWENEGYIDSSYLEKASHEGEKSFDETFRFDLSTKELIDKEVTWRTSDKYTPQNDLPVPENRIGETKNLKDIDEMVKIGNLAEMDNESTDPKKNSEMCIYIRFITYGGALEQPFDIYVTKEMARLRELKIKYERSDEKIIHRIIDYVGGGQMKLNESWRPLTWENDEVTVNYTYENDGLKMEIVNKTTEESETISYGE